MSEEQQERIGVVGLGYVGLPLAAAFANHFEVVGFDVNTRRVADLQAGKDETGEAQAGSLANPRLQFTADPAGLASCTFIIVAVPTPINAAKAPDMTALEQSSATVGRILRPGMMVCYESTVYPSVTEEICLPILERESGLRLGQFQLGYSPERVNPGDTEHRLEDIVKIVSGHDGPALERARRVYGTVIRAGIHAAPSIKTAEAAKVIENVQRDLNIALMNELSHIFSLMDLNTDEVIAAAGTKWNFHRYHPGLVGGHCIGVDPYYLTHRALELGYHPEVILAGRRINDAMGQHLGDLTIRALNRAGCLPRGARIWVLGLTFKENVPDCRNTRAVDVVAYLKSFGCEVKVWEPLVSPEEIRTRFGLDTQLPDQARELDAVVLINGHKAYQALDLATLKTWMRTPVLVDAKNFFSRARARELGMDYVSL